jgi:glycosyltransferase involved in cell wall biosynthesis
MNILFYTPFNSRSRDTESLMEAFTKQGHKVLLLTQTERGPYHIQCEKFGVETFTKIISRNSILYFIRHAFYLIRFCRKHNIHILYSHLENASLPAVLAQYFIQGKVFACRHIIDEAYLLKSKKFILLNKIVYRLAKNIIVVSSGSRDFMIKKEKVDANKIRIIYLAYNFSLFKSSDEKRVNEIRKRFESDILLVTACRLLKPKRVDASIAITEKLISSGINAQLIILGTGPIEEEIKNLIKEKQLAGKVHMAGYVDNVPDYLAAGDILLHPSVQDSSSVIIKEAGLCMRPVIACSGIGDVEDYLVNNINAILVDKNDVVNKMYEAVKKLANDHSLRQQLGVELKNAVIKRFDINTILPQYNEIHFNLTK